MGEVSVSPHRVTQLLMDWSNGDSAALVELTPLVYEQLRRIAHRHMGGQRPDHTLQTTALVNEAYLRLADQTSPSWQNRAHFFAITAQAMRQILVNYARSKRAQKRCGRRAQSRIGRSSNCLAGAITEQTRGTILRFCPW